MRSKTIIIASSAVFFLLCGCTVPPGDDSIRAAVERYFAREGLAVVYLEIGPVSSTPLSDVKYMGTKGYHVSVKRLTLAVRDTDRFEGRYKKGQELTFADGLIIIREQPGQDSGWLITSVSSHLVPQ